MAFQSRIFASFFINMRDSNVFGFRTPRRLSQIDNGAMYEDQYCALSKTILTIKHFHYPSGESLQIPLDHIFSVQYEKGHTDFRSCKRWGMALNNIWWARDEAREFDKNRYVVVVAMEGSFQKKGFTVEDIRSFLSALSQLIRDEGKFVEKICI